MDSQEQLHELSTQHIVPAQLWIGQHEELVAQVCSYLQKTFCRTDGCGTCATCRSIAEQQHHSVTWLMPDKQYTLEQIAIIGETIAYALNDDQRHFFIIQKAETLSPTCSNSLLKSVEEPPAGYHFIFLTDRAHLILPTIKSRCVMHTFRSAHTIIEENPLYTLFANSSAMAPSTFLKLIDKSAPNDRESVDILEKLLVHWITQYKNALIHGPAHKAEQAEKIVGILRTAALQPPMSGSSKLFWKNLFLSIKN